MAFYDELMIATEDARRGFLQIPILKAGVAGTISLHTYVAFLTEAYHHVKHTVPLLMTCGGRLASEYEWLRVAIGEYIEEEMGHQEWVLNDIRHCGHDAAAVRDGVPLLATELMVAYAYDTIMRKNPLGFFGMVLVLEGTSIALATRAAGSIQSGLNLPNEAFSYLSSHGQLDIGHMDFFERLMNRIEDNSDQEAIVHSAHVFYRLYGDIFRAIEAQI